jgi:hypothetical protein
MNYEQDIEIDEGQLDVELLDQARTFLKYARYAAEAGRAVDLAKEALDVERATIDQEVRSNPEAFNITKMTEATVQNAVITDARHQVKSQHYIEAKYEFQLAQAAVRAFDQRKTALENLVKLHGMSYFAGPSSPRDLTEEREKRNRLANQRVVMRRR